MTKISKEISNFNQIQQKDMIHTKKAFDLHTNMKNLAL